MKYSMTSRTQNTKILWLLVAQIPVRIVMDVEVVDVPADLASIPGALDGPRCLRLPLGRQQVLMIRFAKRHDYPCQESFRA